jgi:Tetratricopeptide repeat.
LIELNPERAEYYFLRGNLLEKLQKHEDSKKDLEKAYKLDPSNPLFRNNE